MVYKPKTKKETPICVSEVGLTASYITADGSAYIGFVHMVT
jgi:hypothetical protein